MLMCILTLPFLRPPLCRSAGLPMLLITRRNVSRKGILAHHWVISHCGAMRALLVQNVGVVPHLMPDMLGHGLLMEGLLT